MSEKISRRNFLRTATLGAATAGLLAGCGNSGASSSTAAGAAAGTYTAGTYSATATGINTATPVTVTMTFSADAITDVQIDVANETKGYGADIADEMVKKILDAQSSEVDGHSGATIHQGKGNAIQAMRPRTLTWSSGVPVLPVCPPQAGLPSWAAMWLCCRSRASWSARATAAPPSSSPSPPTRARRCGCT